MANLTFFGEPRVPRLPKLLEEIRRGEIRISRFQRPFVWTDEQRLALVESIYRGYPIGAILVWRTSGHKLATYDHLGPLLLPPETDDGTIRQYLLDGHQRLTTLFASLGPGLYRRDEGEEPKWMTIDEEERTRWPIYFDLEMDRAGRQEENPFQLLRQHEKLPLTWLSLEILFDSYAIHEFEEKLKEKKYGRDVVNRVQHVVDTFRDYAIPVMPIASENLGPVTTTFKRINTGGTPMSEVHMINALTYRPGFDFLARIEEIATELKQVGWSSFDPQWILHICKARLEFSLYDVDPEKLADRLAKDTTILDSVKDDIVKAAIVLDKIAGVRGPASLPYSYQAVLLAGALNGVDAPSDKLLARLRIWFWATTLGEYFAGMTRSQLDRTLQHLHGLVHENADPHPPGLASGIDPVARFDFRSARARGLALLMAEKSPASLDARRDDPFDILAEYGSDALSKLIRERDVGPADQEIIHGVGNRFLVHPRSVGVLLDLKQGPGLFNTPTQLEAHFVDPNALDALWNKDWPRFIRLRRAAIEQFESARADECGFTYRPRG